MFPDVLINRTAILVSSVTICYCLVRTYVLLLPMFTRKSSSASVANRAKRIFESLPTALWRRGMMYLSHSLLQLSKPFIVISLRSVVLACHAHNVIMTFCNTDASMASFVSVTTTCVIVTYYDRACCTSCKYSSSITIVGSSSILLKIWL